MIFSNPAYDVDHNTAKPAVGSQYESVRKVWDMIGRYQQDPVQQVLYAPIGPRLLITVGHIAAVVGWQISMQGQTYTVTAVQVSAYQLVGTPGNGNPGIPYICDAVYVTVDKDIPQWFRRIQDADLRNITPANLLLHIGGGVGGQVVTDSEGWLVCSEEPDYAKSNRVRWSIQRLDYFGPYNPFPPNPAQPPSPPYFDIGAMFKHFNALDGHPETASPKNADSGSPVFVNCGPSDDPWVFAGCVSAPGSRAVSPYKGEGQPGTFAAMSYLDDAAIRQLNGEPPANPPLLVGITVEPQSVVAGHNGTGRVDITGAAPPGGVVVTLTSQLPNVASVPSTVTVIQGQIFATFPIVTSYVQEDTSVEIHALLSLSGFSTSIEVTVYVPPVITPPVINKPLLVRKPVTNPPAVPVTDFERAINNGMQFSETSFWPSPFTLDGNSKQFTGNFNQYQGSQQIGPGGYEEHVDGILVASKPQFGSVRPFNGQRLTLGGRRYIAVEIHEDMASWDFILKGVNE